ncbi:MAG: sulfotransferase [Cyanobacteria bacterium P01_A01_bin.123]
MADTLSAFQNNRVLSKTLHHISPNLTKPVFIISAPRSGSSYLYEIARKMQGVISFNRENSALWFRVFPYADASCASDYIGIKDCTPNRCASLKSLIATKAVFDRKRIDREVLIKNFVLRRSMRYMEKTISNCFHLDAIEKIFPDAIYIHLVRDGRDNISSMIEGWNTFVKVGIDLPTSTKIKHWAYAMPPGWQTQVEKPIEEICAWSWIEHNRYVLDKFTGKSNSGNYIRLYYEDLLSNPLKMLEKISTFADLPTSEQAFAYINSKKLSWSAISPPKRDKWKELNLEKIERISPKIEPMMKKLGYSGI